MKIIDVVETAKTVRQKQIDAWIQDLERENSAAKAGQKEPKRLLYSVNYRISDTDSKTKGGGNGRREAIRAILEALQPRERHISTSTYLISVYIQDANKLIDLLTPPLDLALDGLHVRQAHRTNGTHRGSTGLQP